MKNILTFLFLNCFVGLNAQSWINYSSDYWINDVDIYNNEAWVSLRGGLVKIDLNTNQKEIFQAWNSGIIGTGVNEMEIASDGTKWICPANSGLQKFDGQNWEHFYEINTGDIIRDVSELKLDSNDNPWFTADVVCSNNAYCKRFISYNGTTFQDHNSNLNINSALANRKVDFDFIDDENMWVAFADRVVKYDGNQILETYYYPAIDGFESSNINSIEVYDANSLFICISNGFTSDSHSRILKFDGQNWTTEINSIQGRVANSFKDLGGDIWFDIKEFSLESSTYCKFDGLNWTIINDDQIPEIPNAFDDPVLLEVDMTGNWWSKIFTSPFEPKLLKTSNNVNTLYDTEISLIGSHYYFNLFSDCNNDMWMTGHSGFDIFDGQNWSYINPEDLGFSYINGNTAAVDPATCDIWFGAESLTNTDYNLTRFDGNNFDALSMGVGDVKYIDFDSTGMVRLVTHSTSSGDSLGVYQNGVWSYYHSGDAPFSNFIRDVKIQADGTFWLSSSALGGPVGGVVKKVGDEWTSYNAANSPLSGTGGSLYMFDDEIWVPFGNNKLAKYNEQTDDWDTYDLEIDIAIFSLAKDQLGNFWIGTLSNGVYYWDGFELLNFNKFSSDLGSNQVEEIEIHPAHGDIWFVNGGGAGAGVSVLSDFHAPQNINGFVFYDANMDGLFDNTEDIRLPGQHVYLYPDSIQAITNNLGAYSFHPEQIGDYQISYVPTVPYQPTSPTLLDTFFNDESIEFDFGTWIADPPVGMTIDVTTSPLICSEISKVWVTFKNEGLEAISGEITLTFEDDFSFAYSNPVATSIEAEQIKWEFENLGFMQSRTYELHVEVPGVELLGEAFIFAATLETLNGIEETNTTDIILCSFDPNDKLSSSTGDSYQNYSLLSDPIEYTIRFQNFGNYFARDIVITDILDPSLDITTFEIVAHSHPMSTTVDNDRKVTFTFNNIDLPAEVDDALGSQGFVKYRISPLSGLPDPTLIQNSANIFFDSNPPILTNTTENILVEMLPVNTEAVNPNSNAHVFPNPTNSEIWIEWFDLNTNAKWSATIFDLSGKLVLHQESSSKSLQITLPKEGFYFLKIQKGNHHQVEKIIVMKN